MEERKRQGDEEIGRRVGCETSLGVEHLDGGPEAFAGFGDTEVVQLFELLVVLADVGGAVEAWMAAQSGLMTVADHGLEATGSADEKLEFEHKSETERPAADG